MTASGDPRRRITRAALAFLVAWLATGVVWVLLTRPWNDATGPGPGWSDALALLLIEAGFAAIGWFLVVLPIVRFANHESRFFRPLTSPLIGAACGVGILLAEYAAFFGLPPWEVLSDLEDPTIGLMVLMAAVFGAALWWTYTWVESRSPSTRSEDVRS